MKNNRKFYEQPLVAVTAVSDCDIIRTSGELDQVIELDEIELTLN